MTTKAERQAHREAGLSASDFPMPPIPLMHPNAEWCESYARWHSQFVAASRRPAVEAAPSGAEEMARALYDAPSAEDGTSFIGEFSASGPVTIDGRFDLSKVAGRLSAARAVSAPAAAPGGVEDAQDLIEIARHLERLSTALDNNEALDTDELIEAMDDAADELRRLSASPAAPAAQSGETDNGWFVMVGDWRDERVAIHGPNGHIASGLTAEQANALIEAHGRRAVGSASAPAPREAMG